ncbi:MAG: hypothetical protein U9R74_00215 [Pseudomonadota bacterium]|nr:hypothetical protein [Pseudomonadota bacterium]
MSYVTVGATPKTGEKTSRLVCHLTEIALDTDQRLQYPVEHIREFKPVIGRDQADEDFVGIGHRLMLGRVVQVGHVAD